jgi:hypothetical protein
MEDLKSDIAFGCFSYQELWHLVMEHDINPKFIGLPSALHTRMLSDEVFSKRFSELPLDFQKNIVSDIMIFYFSDAKSFQQDEYIRGLFNVLGCKRDDHVERFKSQLAFAMFDIGIDVLEIEHLLVEVDGSLESLRGSFGSLSDRVKDKCRIM